MSIAPIQLDCSPQEALAAWPRDFSLAVLWSGGGSGDSRWTILARPGKALASTGLADFPPANPAIAPRPNDPPFIGGWIGMLSYDLGRALEPKARGTNGAQADRSWPLARWHRVDDAFVFDHATRSWFRIGDGAALPIREVQQCSSKPPLETAFRVGPLVSRTGRDAFVSSVARALEYIRAGDVYQVNLAHRLSAPFQGSSRALFSALADSAKPWHGAYLESTENHAPCAILSASPEMFLSFDPRSRAVVTRPMKGTRPLSLPSAERELLDSEKDRAELNMIIDLMRNDLGKVCEIGSVRVERERVLEQHADVLQATATVTGILRRGLAVQDLLTASFPGGSVTGAPKIRAMQIIDELEPVRRGPYCGSIGFISDNGHTAFNIAIRTALIHDGTLDYSVGAGIVADSDPEAEWQETLVKAGAIMRLAVRAGPMN